jgi:endonuclease/exonuclease/phosphatase family protein
VKPVAAVLCLLAALTALPAPARADSPDRLRVGTFNIDRDRGFGAWRAAIVAFRRGVDVAGLQEVSGPAKRAFLSDGRWGAYGRGEDPVVWDRRDFRATHGRRVRIAASSYATVVRLRHRASGTPYAVLNVHLVWGRSPGVHRLRVAQLRGLARAAAREQAAGSRVLVVGDFNVDHAVDRRQRRPGLPVHRLGRLGLVSAWSARDRLPRHRGSSTLGAGYIDQVWSATPALRVRAWQHVSGGQHHPVVAAYDVGATNRAPTPR